MHILFVIISIFPNAAVPRRDKNTLHQFVRIAEATLFSTSRIGGPILFLPSLTFRTGGPAGNRL